MRYSRLVIRAVRGAGGALCLLGFLSGCSLTSSNSENEVEITFKPQRDLPRVEEQIGPDEENVIGRAVSAKILGTFSPWNSNALSLYVNRVGKTVAGASPRPATFLGYSFVIVNDPNINALAAPGGYIFISHNLLSKLSDEDMLAAVLAHEVAHVVERHGLKAIAREHLADYTPVGDLAISAVDCSGLSEQLVSALNGAVSDIVDKLLVSGYSREQEISADALAVQILRDAGYDPGALDRVLALLEKESDGGGGWFSTHPKASDRRTALKSVPPSKVDTFRKGFEARKKRFADVKAADA